MSNPFEQFQTDIIRIISKDRTRTSADLKASVTSNSISLYDINVDVVEGDFIERDLPNNRTECYLILEATFCKRLAVIPDHYIFKVRKTTAISHTNGTKNVYNLTGNNPRVYNNSYDQSNNIVKEGNNEVFELLKQAISINVENNDRLLILLEELRQSTGKSNYVEKYSAFIANAANHMTVIAPYIPALTALLTPA